VRLVAAVATRMGFDASDVDTLVALVRDHLLLAETATRRDLSDPATVDSVATRVGTTEQLELLAALTEADARATGPAAWSPWKAELIGELVARTRGQLAGSAPPPPVELPSATHRALMAERTLRVVPDGETLTMVAPDRPGLLAVVAGVLSLHRLSVRSAAAASEDGMAVDVFHLDTGRAAFPDWAHIGHDLQTALEDPALLHRRLADRARADRRSPAVPPADTNVVVDNDATPRATVVEVRTEDGPGVLHRLALLLAEGGLDIASAKVETLGHDVVDTFYVRVAADGGKLTDDVAIELLRAEIVAALDGPT
jgi:[protein-PII] uridylyltransferase